MSERDYIKEYEEAMASLEASGSPLARPPKDWTEEEAREVATLAFAGAPEDQARRRLVSEARDAIRAAKTTRRLDGIRKRRPDLAQIIDEELDWLAYNTGNWDSLPFEVQVRDWVMISAMPDKGSSVKSTRGTGATWPGIREAAFVLIDWRMATEGERPSIGWLGDELERIQPDLKKRSALDGIDRAKKLARQMLDEHRSQHSS